MRIETPNPDNPSEPLIKEVRVNGGVKVRLDGTKYLTEATVQLIDEDREVATIKGVGFTAEVHKSLIIDSMEPAMHQYQQQYDQGVSKTHRPPGADETWPKIGQ